VRGLGAAGVQLVRVHQHDGTGRRQVLAAAVAEALHPGLDRAQPERLVGMRLEGVAHDMGAVQLHPRRRQAEFGTVGGVLEHLRHPGQLQRRRGGGGGSGGNIHGGDGGSGHGRQTQSMHPAS